MSTIPYVGVGQGQPRHLMFVLLPAEMSNFTASSLPCPGGCHTGFLEKLALGIGCRMFVAVWLFPYIGGGGPF